MAAGTCRGGVDLVLVGAFGGGVYLAGLWVECGIGLTRRLGRRGLLRWVHGNLGPPVCAECLDDSVDSKCAFMDEANEVRHSCNQTSKEFLI